MNCLDATLYPSLVLALLDKNYVKKYGSKKGTSAVSDIYMSGRWYSPWRYINDVDSTIRDAIYNYIEKYGDCLGISISPGDEDLIFVVAFLTQNTNYHVNVLRWADEIFAKSEDLSDIAEIAPAIGRSYQLQRLPHAVRAFIELGKPRERRDLIKITSVGPKVADLYLLFTGDTTSPPVDKHFVRMAPIFKLKGRPPMSTYCRKYSCDACPHAGNCLRNLAASKLGRLAGWVQTLAYLLDKGVLKNLNTSRGFHSMGWRKSL